MANDFNEAIEDYNPDDFHALCNFCGGSGEGATSESRCVACGGEGEFRVDYDAPTYDDIFYAAVDRAMDD